MPIERGLLVEEFDRCREMGSTARPCREFLLRVAHESLVAGLGQRLYLKSSCVSALTIQHLLREFGIRSQVWMGAACFSRVSADYPPELGWTGFWGESRHFWTLNEFNELIDLAIAQLHFYCTETAQPSLPIPALWWDDACSWPPIIRYLPEATVERDDLVGPQREQLDQVLAAIPLSRAKLAESHAWSDRLFSNVLHGMDQLQQIAQGDEPWATRSTVFQDQAIPLPEWVRQRELALEAGEWPVDSGG